ncbi:DUF3987 domain-containing protein [Actinacidiphila alni]|uniref:DUF3987 domain-containing protein n=1 Tax=Actinacidiphila alni TaxID=380248 RepID=UPI003455BB17
MNSTTAGAAPPRMIASAQQYAARGWRVLPLHHQVDGRCTCGNPKADPKHDYRQGGKHPVHASWQKDASADWATIADWWRARPTANIGIATGKASGIFVLDVDPDSGGLDSLTALEAAHGRLPATWRVETGSGGLHFYFAWPGFNPRNSAGKLGPGLDIRADGGQVVAPPSVSVKGPYTVRDDTDPAPAPEWLVEMIRPAAPRPALPPGSFTAAVGNQDAYTRKAVQAECDAITGALDGMQNDTINRAAFNVGTLVGAGAISEGEARETLLSAAIAGNHPEGRARATINSGLTKGMQSPRRPWPPASRRDDTAALRALVAPDGVPPIDWSDTEASPPQAPDSVISVRQSVGVEDEWEEPLSIDRPQLTPFPVKLLGPELAAVVDAVTAQVQVAPDIPAMIALAAISTAVGGRAVVRIRPGWSESTSLWTATVAGAGERKSAAEGPFSDALRAIERDLQAKAIPEIEDAEQQVKIAQARLEDAEKAAIKAKADKRELLMDEARLAKRELRELGPVPEPPRLLFGDITPAAMPLRAAQQGGRMAVIHSEGTLIKQMGGLYNSGASDTGFALDAYDGKAMPVDRIGRDSIQMESAHLAIGLLVQPIILEQLGRKKDDEMLHNGFVQRFLYGFPSSRLGYQDPRGSVPIPSLLLDDLRERLRALVNRLWASALVTPVSFTDEASEAMYVFQEQMQERLRRGGDLHQLASWASKLPGKLARVAALITLYEDPAATQVTAERLTDALALAPYFITHARLCLDLMGANRDAKLMPARDVLGWLRRRKEDKRQEPFTVRDAQRGVDGNAWGPDGVTSEAVQDAIHTLADRGWVVALPAPPRPEGQRGRAPSPRYLPHPLVWDETWKKKEVSETRLRSA